MFLFPVVTADHTQNKTNKQKPTLVKNVCEVGRSS